jgi:hypothetical protein
MSTSSIAGRSAPGMPRASVRVSRWWRSSLGLSAAERLRGAARLPWQYPKPKDAVRHPGCGLKKPVASGKFRWEHAPTT